MNFEKILKFHDISWAGSVSIFLWKHLTSLNRLKFHMHVSDDDSNMFCKFDESWWTLKNCWNSMMFLGPVSQFILPPGQRAPRGKPTAVGLPPGGASCLGISCPLPWLSSPPGGKLSRLVYLAPRPTQVKIYTCYFVIFLYHFNEFRSSISHKVRNWCLWG